MKKITSTFLALIIAALAPGFGSYAAAGETFAAGKKGSAVKPVPGLQISVGQAHDAASNSTGISGLNQIAQVGMGAGVLPDRGGLIQIDAVQKGNPARVAPQFSLPQAVLKTGSPGATPADMGSANSGSAESAGAGNSGSALDDAKAAAQDVPSAGSNFIPEPVWWSQGAKAFDAFDAASVRGKTLLLVGTSATRHFILQDTARVAKELGLNLVVVDKKEARGESQDLIPDSHFIEAPIDKHDEAVMEESARKVAEYSNSVRKIDFVLSLLNPYVEVAGKIVDKTGAVGNTGDATKAAHTKDIARERLWVAAPEITVPFRKVESVQEAVRFYREVTGTTSWLKRIWNRVTGRKPKEQVVMKPIHGGGSTLVVVDIDSEEAVKRSYREVEEGLKAFASRPDAGFFMLDKNPGIMMEKQISGPEVDVELIIQPGPDGRTEVRFGHVSDNPPMEKPYAVEKGVTFPSQLPEWVQQVLIEAAGKAARALGLKYGNHVEMMMSPEGPKVLEVNARMGGAFVWEFMKVVTGISLIEETIRALVGLSVNPGRKPSFVLEGRFVIPMVSGVIESIEGLEEAKRLPGIERVRPMKKAGDRILAAPDDMFDYVAYLSATGATYDEAMAKALAALKAITIRIRKADGTLVTQTGEFTHAPVDMKALLSPEQRGEQPAAKGGLRETLSKLWLAFKSLPASFKLFLLGSGILAGASEGIAVIFSTYGFSTFGLIPGILLAAVGIIFRIPGSLLGAKFVRKFDARKIYIATTVVMALLLISLPLGSGLLGGGALYLALNFFVQIMSGFIYGATRGMAENQILPRLVGQDKKQLEIAGFLFMITVEAFSLAAAWALTPLLKSVLAAYLGAKWAANAAIGILGALMLSSIGFFRKMKLNDEAGSTEEEKQGTEESLPLREYIPYAASTFVHFAVYGLFFGAFAKYIFQDDIVSAFMMGSYDTGSLGMGLMMAIPALLAALSAGSQGSAEKKKGMAAWLDKIPLKAWFALAALAAAAYLWAGVGAMLILSLAAAAVLGGLVTVNRAKWMASYLNRLKPERHARVIAVLNSVSTLLALLPFAAISIGTIAGVAMMPLLCGTIAAISIALGLAWVLTRQPEAPATGQEKAPGAKAPQVLSPGDGRPQSR